MKVYKIKCKFASDNLILNKPLYRMAKICLNNRDDMLMIDLDKIAYIKANGNYAEITYIEGQKQMLTLGLTKIEDIIKSTYPAGVASPFVRLGRSMLFNQTFVYSISTLRQKLVLSDYANHTYVISVPKPLLKEYKKVFALRFVQSKQA